MSEKRKQLLIITYYWPPAGGSGVQRWLKFAKYLTQFGWEPIIFTPENPAFDLTDKSLLKEIPANMLVEKLPINEPLHLVQKLRGKKKAANYQHRVLDKKNRRWFERIALWIRANLFMPDPRIVWVKPAFKHITGTLLKKYNIKAIVTTGPPFSLHVLGLKLRETSGIPWVADFRDPWSDWDILRELGVKGEVLKRHVRLERQVLTVSDAVLTSSLATTVLLKQKVDRDFWTITNGADVSDFSDHTGLKPNRFRLLHAGRLYGLRNPTFLWEAIEELLSEQEELAEELELELIGEVADEVSKLVNSFPLLGQCVKIIPYQPHELIVRKYAEAALLLLFMNKSDNSRLIIPGKIFEYMASKRPILMTGVADSPAAEILLAQKAGAVFEEDQKEAVKSYLMLCFHNYKSGRFETVSDISQFDRVSLTGRLAAQLDQLIEHKNK